VGAPEGDWNEVTGSRMGFRRDGEAAHDRARSWRAWLDANAHLLRASGLPPSVVRIPDDWQYLLRYGYHFDGPYPAIETRLEELTEAQRAAFRELLAATLSAGQRECAAWHFVCPPGPPAA
jgi:hypothetical protein